MPTAIRPLSPAAKAAILRDLSQRIRHYLPEEPYAEALDVKDAGGYGVLLWLRTHGEDRFIVHRWAMLDTAGNDISFRLYDGSYYDTLDEAKEDFEETRPR